MSTPTTISRSKIATRRLKYSAIAIFVCALVGYILFQLEKHLLQDAFLSGYLLLGAIIFLTLFNLRKRLTFLPSIGSAATWMQLHIYVGLSTFLIFGFHIAWHVPDGWFEGLLAILYLTVALSGVYGLVITRIMPKRLTAIGNEVIFEQIPALRLQLAREVRQLALAADQSNEVVSRYYLHQLLPFFEKPRSLAYLAFPTGRKKRVLLQGIDGLKRYLDQDSRGKTDELAGYVQQKDDLDYQEAIQGRLKVWMFLHVGFTYSLLIFSILHAILVHAFIGGWF